MKRSEDKRGEVFGKKKKNETNGRNWENIVYKMEFSSSFFFFESSGERKSTKPHLMREKV